MANLPENYVGKLTNKNRKYWCLREALPTKANEIRFSSYFIIHNKWWRYLAHVDDSSLLVIVSSDVLTKGQFNVRMGIFGESGENVVTSDAEAVSIVEYKVANFISNSQLDTIAQSDDLYIFFVEIEKKDGEKEQKAKKKEEEKEQKSKVCKRKFEMDYKELLLSGKNSDLILNVKSRKFNCHALILGARSPVFSAMMEHEMKEKCNGEVFIPDADPAIFKDFLLYLYTGKEEQLNWENVTDLYKLGDKYCVDDLKYLCFEHMKRNMSIENFFNFFLISQQHSDSELSEAGIEFFLENSEDIVESEKWAEFIMECPAETSVLVKSLVKQNMKAKHNL